MADKKTHTTFLPWDEIEKALAEAAISGSCTAECNFCYHSASIEADGDYPCPECGKGRIVSPILTAGLI